MLQVLEAHVLQTHCARAHDYEGDFPCATTCLLFTRGRTKVATSPRAADILILSFFSQVQRGLGTLLSLIPFVAAEYRLFSTPHHTNGATIDAAVHATQHMADIATLAFAMKREHGALGRWKIPSLQYTHVSEVLGCIADAVEALQKTIKGTMDLKR